METTNINEEGRTFILATIAASAVIWEVTFNNRMDFGLGESGHRIRLPTKPR